MTTVAGLQGDGWIVLACDSRTTEGTKIYNLPPEMSKVVTVGKYLIGVTGELRVIPLLRHAFSPTPAPTTARGEVLDAFITKTFIPELEKFVAKYLTEKPGTPPSEDDDEEDTRPVFLVAVNGVIYEIDSDYAWVRDTRGVYAIGSGGQYAIGVLLSNPVSTASDGEAIAEKSIDTAILMDSKTGGLVRTFNQKASGKK